VKIARKTSHQETYRFSVSVDGKNPGLSGAMLTGRLVKTCCLTTSILLLPVRGTSEHMSLDTYGDTEHKISHCVRMGSLQHVPGWTASESGSDEQIAD
jgi:hypothetical protein